MIRRLIGGLLLLFAAQAQAITINVDLAASFDGTFNTGFPAGDKPINPEACDTWTCDFYGDAAGTINEDSATQITLSVASTSDEGNQGLAYKEIATGNDIEVKVLIPSRDDWLGHNENFTSIGVGIAETEEVDPADDVFAQCSLPFTGGVRFKSGTPGSTTSETGDITETGPEWLIINYDVSATDIRCMTSSDDGAADDYELVGTARDITLTCDPCRAYVFLTSHDVNNNTTLTVTNASATTTITETGETQSAREVLVTMNFETGAIQPNSEAVDGAFIHTLPITQVGATSFSTGSGCCDSSHAVDTRVIQSRTPPNTGNGAPSEGAVGPRAGTYYLENALYLTKNYTQLTAGLDRPRTKFYPNQFGMEFDEEFYYGYSIYLPTNLEIEPSGGGRTNLLSAVTTASGTQFAIGISDPEVGSSKWALLAQTTDGNITESGATNFDIDLGLISEDRGHWTDIIIRYRGNPFASGEGYDCPVNPVTDLSVSGAMNQDFACDVGILQVWKSVGEEDENGDREMRRMYSRVDLPVGLVPHATLPIKFNIQTYKPTGKTNSQIDGPMWIPFDEIYFGTVDEHGTGFDDVHPTQKTCAEIAETPAECP